MRGVLIGRFQPFHAGHLGVVRAIRAEAPERDLVVVIGSAEESYTWENPFTAGERFEMVERACREAKLTGVTVVPVEDIRRHTQWAAYLAGLLPPFDTVYTNNPLTRLLFERAGYAVRAPAWVDRARFEGVAIRERIADGKDLTGLVPPSVEAYLAELGAAARLSALRARPVVPPPARRR